MTGAGSNPASAFRDPRRRELDQLRGLLTANRTIISDLDLPAVLRRIVDAARDLVGARYSALGIVASDGHLANFVHIGMPPDAVEAIGRLPQGKGLLGAVIEERRPIRVDRISDDARSSGFPAGHPPMQSLIGIPIWSRGELFANLYVADDQAGRFSEEDEELLLALAATAGFAIDNSRLYEHARSRQAWLRALAKITRQLLADAARQPLQVIAGYARDIADADVVTILLPSDDGLRVEVAAGQGGEALVGIDVPLDGTLSGAVFRSGEPLRVAHQDERHGLSALALGDMDIGPVIVTPLRGAQKGRGVLIAARLSGRLEFTAEDLDMATAFANQASLAIELAEARNEHQRTALHDERDRIAAGLHDHVIQRLFVVGLAMQSIASGLDPGPTRERVVGTIGDLDDAIAQIRTTIFALHRLTRPASSGLRGRLLDVVNELTPALAFSPAIRFTGLLDESVPPGIADDLIVVLRETLIDIARDATATSADVAVTGRPSHLTLDVTDNGADIEAAMLRRGLKELRVRTERHEGTLTIAPREPAGTHLSWSVPIP